jgi:hypothetical protein
MSESIVVLKRRGACIPTFASNIYETASRLVGEQVYGKPSAQAEGFYFVRPAGRIHLEVKVLYTPGKGKC